MGAKVSKTQFLPPGMAVSLVWGRSNLLSASPEVNEIGQEYLAQVKNIKEKAINDPVELRYIEEATAYMNSTFRNIVTIIRGRNLNFKEAEKIHDDQQKIIDQYKTFSMDLQSIIPRLSGMAIGGVSGAVILNQLIPEFVRNTFGDLTIPVLLAIGAAAGYIIYGWWVVPWVSKMKGKEMVKIDYDRNLYYDQYLTRTKSALAGLYNRVDDLHNSIFNQRYDQVTGYDFVKSLWGGMDSTMCKFVTDCIPKGYVDTDLWSTCETGVNLDKCDIRKSKVN